jgi:hypothetical protein
MQNYFMNFLINFLLYISIPIVIRYLILKRPIESKWIAIGILIPIFIGSSILLNIQRDELLIQSSRKINIPYKPGPHMIGSPVLYVAMALSYVILRRRNKETGAIKPQTKDIAIPTEETEKKEIFQENKPNDISNYQDSSFKKNNKAVGILSIGYTIPIIAIIIALVAIIYYHRDKLELNKAAVPEATSLLKETKKAAEQGDARAQVKLFDMYNRGEGVTEDIEEGSKWLFKAAEQGDASAQFIMGTLNYQMQDYKEAAKWLTKAAEQGDARAQFMLGNLYYFGYGVTKDYKEAAKWCSKGAEQGDARAQVMLGNLYCFGYGVTKDYKEAAKWCSKGAEQGDARAQGMLGIMYLQGEGVMQDYKEAAKWLTKGAEQADARAQIMLGIMYKNGVGVTQDYIEAYKWFNLAAAQGDDESRNYRDKLIKIMTPGQIDKAQRLSREFGKLQETSTTNLEKNQK